MKCPKCGTENNDANNFCHVCGAKLSKDSDIEKKHRNPARTQKILVVLVIVLVIICVLFALLWMYSRQANVTNEVIEQEDLSSEVTEISNEDDTLLGEPIEESKDIVYDVNNLSKEQRNMLGPMDTLFYSNYEPDVTYDWGSVCLLLSNYSGLFIESGSASYEPYSGFWVTEDILKECASALFVNFDGEIPEIPWSDGAWSLERDGDYYHLSVGDRGVGEGVGICSWVEHSDGSCTVELKRVDDYFEDNGIGQSSDEPICRFELIKNSYTESFANPLFAYTIESMERLNENGYAVTATNNYYILPDSDTRYYTESELSGFTNDKLRLARNEIYARHGRKFDSEDLQEYFDSQAWYHGTIEPADFSESILNDCEKANIKTIEAMENGTTTWREAYGEYIKEIEDIGPHNYSLIYLDNDDIPELYIAGNSEAEGDLICTVDSDGNIVEFRPGRNYGIRYVEFSGRLFNWYSHFGYNELTFYKLENGEFTIIDTEPCAWMYDEEIPEDEFYEKWGDLIDFDSIVHPWDTLYSANEILSIIYN